MADVKLDVAFWNYDRTRALGDAQGRLALTVVAAADLMWASANAGFAALPHGSTSQYGATYHGRS